ncbi:MAG: M56 family metallopeptidase, partial [Oscillospiraceae bacterium]
MEWIVSSSVLILAVILLRYLLRGKISLCLQYALWALVLVRLLVPVSFGSTPLSIMNPAQQVPVVQDVETLRGIGGIEHTQSGNVEGYYATDYRSDFPTTIAQNKSDAEFSRMKTILDVRELLIPVWKLGIAVMLAALFLSNARFRQALNHRRTRLEKPDYPLPVYVTDAVETPCLFGLFSPTVYITPEVQENPITLHHALEHELTHFRHGDHFWSVLRCVCLALHWYNPLVWAAVILSRRDAELACDEGTIRRIGESERIAYGNTLIDLTCAKRKPSALLCTATTMTGSKKSIEERVTLIAKKPKMLWITVVAVILTAAVAVGCTFTGAKKMDTSGESEDITPLTAEELAYFNDAFFNGDEFNIYNQFLSSLYDIPQDIDLFELFYCGTGLSEELSDEERQSVISEFYDGVNPDCACTKNSTSDMDTVLEQCMGLSVADASGIGLDSFHYLKNFDAYYYFHGDTNYRGEVVVSAGARQGDLISLYYDDTFMANGSKVVTLRKMKDGGYQFVSNRYNAAPTVAKAIIPDVESVLSVKLSELSPHVPTSVVTEGFARQDWGELVDNLWYQGAGVEPNRGILVGNWPGEGIYACYVVYDDTAGEDVYHRFTQLCTAESAQNILEHPDWISIAPFTDLFGYDGFVITSDGLSRYYFFGKDGQLNLLYSTYGKLDQLFTAGEDCIYAFDDAGHADDPAMLVQKSEALYRADLSELLTRLAPELFEPWLDVSASNGLGTLHYSDTSLEQMPLCTRRVCCDGTAIQFYYGDGKTYTGHLVDGIEPLDEQAVRNQPYTYEGSHMDATYYPYYAVNGDKNVTWTFVLAQPATQGDGGIWCVERWLDVGEFPATHLVRPDTTLTNADYYADLQKKADSGEADWALDPMEVCLRFAYSFEGGHRKATVDSFSLGEVYSSVPGSGNAGAAEMLESLRGSGMVIFELTLLDSGSYEPRKLTVSTGDSSLASLFSALTEQYNWVDIHRQGPLSTDPWGDPDLQYFFYIHGSDVRYALNLYAGGTLLELSDRREDLIFQAIPKSGDTDIAAFVRKWFDAAYAANPGQTADQLAQLTLDTIMSGSTVTMELATADGVGGGRYGVSPDDGNGRNRQGGFTSTDYNYRWSFLQNGAAPSPEPDTLTVETPDGAYALQFWKGSETVRCLTLTGERWLRTELKNAEDDIFATDIFGFMRFWYDEAEFAGLTGEIVIPNRGQSHQKIAQAWVDGVTQAYLDVTPGSKFACTYARSVARLWNSEFEDDSWYQPYMLETEHFYFSYIRIFVPENEQSRNWQRAGNTGDYDGAYGEAPEGAQSCYQMGPM